MQQSKGKPGCGSSGTFAVTSIEEHLMRARSEGLALDIPAHEVGCRRESFEVFGLKRARGRPLPTGDTTPPSLLLECLPSTPDCLHICHVASLSTCSTDRSGGAGRRRDHGSDDRHRSNLRHGGSSSFDGAKSRCFSTVWPTVLEPTRPPSGHGHPLRRESMSFDRNLESGTGEPIELVGADSGWALWGSRPRRRPPSRWPRKADQWGRKGSHRERSQAGRGGS